MREAKIIQLAMTMRVADPCYLFLNSDWSRISKDEEESRFEIGLTFVVPTESMLQLMIQQVPDKLGLDTF